MKRLPSRRAVHFVGFRGEEYWSAVKAFGPPDFIHRGWDKRARRELADDDLVVFASGDFDQPIADRNFSDIDERWLMPSHRAQAQA